MTTLPEMNTHVDGTPDVPDIVHPGDWLSLIEDDDFESFVLVVKMFKTEEGEWDYCPGAEGWTILYLGIGYLTGEKLSSHDCGGINDLVAVNGELLPLYKLGWNENRKFRVCPKPAHVSVTKEAESLIRRMNAAERPIRPRQLQLFANTN